MSNAQHTPGPTTGIIYFHGDAAEYTGKTDIIYGALFYEIRMVEGHRKGDLLWTTTPPVSGKE